MLEMGEGRADRAWELALATARLGRLEASGPSLIEFLVGGGIDSLSTSVSNALAAGGPLSAVQADAMLADLRALPPMPSLVAALQTERFLRLDAVMILYRGNDIYLTETERLRLTGFLDWDAMLRTVNDWCNQEEAALTSPDPEDRRRRAKAMEEAFLAEYGGGNWLEQRARTLPVKLHFLRIGGRFTRGWRTRAATRFLISVLRSSLDVLPDLVDTNRVRRELRELALCVRLYEAREGASPDDLAALVPDYIDALPDDPFAGGPITYVRTDDGCKLYSVGMNYVDDGGLEADRFKSEEEQDVPSGADDIVIELK